jgi:hypothetical protein
MRQVPVVAAPALRLPVGRAVLLLAQRGLEAQARSVPAEVAATAARRMVAVAAAGSTVVVAAAAAVPTAT